jgi:APA family basic amino acid/polyamine antiporter
MTRPVGPLQLLALGVNGIVGVGIFFAPSAVARHAPGTSAILAFACTGLALVPVALAFAVLGRRFDEDGGPVVFARAAFGELASFLVGWVAYVSAFLSTSAVTTGLATAVAPSLGLDRRAAALLIATLLALFVASGIRLSAQAWTTLTVLKLLPLLALLGAFVVSSSGTVAAAAPAREADAGWLRAGLVVLFAYQGFEVVPVVAGRVRAAARSVPFAILGSLGVAIALYLGLAAACVAALPDLAESGAPLADAARVWGGSALASLVAFGTSLSALGICLGMLVTTPRYLSALAGGRRGLFGLESVSARGVPLRALGVTWALVAVFVSASELGELFALSSIAVSAQYAVTAAALLALCLRRERGLSPRHGWLALPALALSLSFALLGATPREALVALGALLAGLGLSLLARPRSPAAC